MAICWERVVPFSFPLVLFLFYAVSILLPVGCLGAIWNSIVSVPDHCLFIYLGLLLSIFSVLLIDARLGVKKFIKCAYSRDDKNG